MIRIYAASLADYNNGLLHGAWIEVKDANGDVDSLLTIIKEKVLDTSPVSEVEGYPAEEYGIFDYDADCHISLSGFGEYPDLQEIVDLDTALEEAREPEALAAYIDHFGMSEIDKFDDRYYGEMDGDEGDFAYRLLEDTGQLSEIPEWAQSYIDFDKYGRDLFMGDFVEVDGYVFWQY